MEILTPSELFKVTLELISKIPEFNGNSNNLINFLDRVDSINTIIDSFDEFLKITLIGFVKDKI